MTQEVVQNQKSMTREEFKNALSELIPRLPYHYGVLIKNYFPETDMRKVYNVIHYKIHDEEIIRKLQFICPSQN